MNPEHTSRLDYPAIRQAVGELETVIRASYPAAEFSVAEGEDPEGVYLRATIDADDLTAVLDLIADPLYRYQVEQELPIFVVPRRPLQRALRERQARRQPNRARSRVGLDEVYSRP
jgi:hypothetical protein